MAMNTINLATAETWYEVTDGVSSVSGTVHNRSGEDVLLYEGTAEPVGNFSTMPAIVLDKKNGSWLWIKTGTNKLYAASQLTDNLNIVFNT